MEHLEDSLGDVLSEAVHVREVTGRLSCQDRLDAALREWGSARESLESDYGKGVEICPTVHWLSEHLLGGGVLWCAGVRVPAAGVLTVQSQGQAEVRDLHSAVTSVDDDVLGFEIAVNQALCVGML